MKKDKTVFALILWENMVYLRMSKINQYPRYVHFDNSYIKNAYV